MAAMGAINVPPLPPSPPPPAEKTELKKFLVRGGLHVGYLLKSNFIVLQLLRDEEEWRDKADGGGYLRTPGSPAEETELEKFSPWGKSTATRRLPLIE